MKNKNSKINLVYCLAFILATYSITEVFCGYKYFKAGLIAQGYLMNSIWLAVFLFTMVFLAYQIYRDEKANNNLRMNFEPFENFDKWLNRRFSK